MDGSGSAKKPGSMWIRYTGNNKYFFGRFIEWVTAPSMGNNLENSVKGKKLTNIQSSKFCTGRHLQYYNETIQLLAELASEAPEERDTKKRKTDKPYTGLCLPLRDCIADHRVLNKISKIFPDIVDTTDVLFLARPKTTTSNMPSLECEAKNQLRLADTLMNSISSLETGDHLIIEGFPIFTRMTVAIFFSFATLFEDIGFVRPQGKEDLIFLSKFLVRKSPSATEDSLSCLEKILQGICAVDKDQMLSVWSVKDLVQDPIYSEMVLFNQLKIKEQILSLTEFLVPPTVETSEETATTE